MASKKKRPAKSGASKKTKPARAARGQKKVKAKAKPKAKAKAQKKKRTPRPAKAVATKPAKKPSGPPMLDEVLEEPLLDVSMVLRVKDRVARSQRDVDEDERQQFSDPSLVVEASMKEPQQDDDADAEESQPRLPGLFAAEAGRQRAAGAKESRSGHEGSLFGTLGRGRANEDGDPEGDGDADSEERDDD